MMLSSVAWDPGTCPYLLGQRAQGGAGHYLTPRSGNLGRSCLHSPQIDMEMERGPFIRFLYSAGSSLCASF